MSEAPQVPAPGAGRRRRRATSATTGTSPATVRDIYDPGDATQRNFRYQHAVAVMLLLAARRGVRPYVAIWCEHYEDVLAERTDGRFDGYQVKTSRPENGAWRVTDEDFVKSIGRFADLVAAFGESIADLFFYSNTEFDIVTPANRDAKRRARCPELFLSHVRTCDSVAALSEPFDGAFDELVTACSCSPEHLLSVLRRVDIIRGPQRHEFEAVLAHEHLGALPELDRSTPAELNQARDNLIAAVFRASSLQVTDPIRHLRPLIAPRDGDPVLAAKRISVAELDSLLSSSNTPATPEPAYFRFTGDPTLVIGAPRSPTRLEQKLIRGGLDEDIVEDLAEKERAAEAHLLEDVARRPELYPALLGQLEGMVLSECREALLRAKTYSVPPFGPQMLIDVQDRLRRLAADRPHTVGGKEPECLLGIAGMLTAGCRLWWSDRFPIDQDAA
jgi:hypothetical protein